MAPQRDGKAPPVLLGCEEATMPPKQGRGCPIPPSGYFPTHVGKLSDREAGAMDRQTPVFIATNPTSLMRSGGVYAATLCGRSRANGAVDGAATHRSRRRCVARSYLSLKLKLRAQSFTYKLPSVVHRNNHGNRLDHRQSHDKAMRKYLENSRTAV